MPLPNEGEYGAGSIRILGKKVDKLPMGMGERAKQQLPDAIRTEIESEARNIIARYPKLTIEYIDGVLKNCRFNIDRFTRVRQEKQDEITRFHRLIMDNTGKPSLRSIEPRIKEIAATDASLEDKKAQIRELKDGCAEYDVAALLDQIGQFQRDVGRFDEAIQRENDSIAEWTKVRGEIEARDRELKALGATEIQ